MPNTPYNTNLPADLRALKEEIEGYARGYGLDFYETIFEVVEGDDLNEIAAYGGFPTRYPHWSFGMAYEELKKGYDYGLSKIYEMVINNDPCYAYLMRCNHVVDQKLVMAHVYGHCLAPETLVEVRSGVKAIEDVYAGEEVLTHTGVYRKVKLVAKCWFKGKIHQLSVSGSNEKVRITGEHPVYVLRPTPCVLAGRQRVSCRPTCKTQHKCSAPRPYETYQLAWVPAEDVSPGDFVVLPRRRSSPATPPKFVEIPVDKVLHRQRITGVRKLPVNKSLAKLIGYFIAEGNAQRRGLVGFGFHEDEANYHAEVKQVVAEVLGVPIGTDHYPESHATTVRFNSVEVAHWLREQVGVGAAEKRIPDFLFDHPDEDCLLGCVQGLFNGDGTYTAATGRRSGTLSLATVSRQLAYQLRHVCARWGIQTSVYSRQRANRQRCYEVIWSGESAHKLSALLMGKDVIEGNRSFERSWSDDNYIYRQVRKVETEDYDGLVYNFSVEEDESYTLAAGFVVHNCDFFKNNAYFAHTSRKMMDEMANHGMRIRRYAEKYGEDEVETFLDKCMSIDDLIDMHSVAIRRREEVSRYDFTPKEEEENKGTRFKSKDYMDDYINPCAALKAEEEERKKLAGAGGAQLPRAAGEGRAAVPDRARPAQAVAARRAVDRPRRGLLLCPAGHDKGNERRVGSYWHSTIMTQKTLQPWECIDYADHHSGTMATYGPRINPYKLGIELLRDIEHRWNTGKFGKEWEECDDLDKRRNWDRQLGLGRQKIFEVRRVHNDITFIDTFLTPEFCREHKMFSFAFQDQAGQYVIESREFDKIKKRLLFSLTNFGKPWIFVVDGNYRNRGELLLRHEHNGVDLRQDQAHRYAGQPPVPLGAGRFTCKRSSRASRPALLRRHRT